MHAPGEKISGSTSIKVRPMSGSDVPDVQAILKESPEASMWSSESLQESVSQGRAWAAELDGRVAGFLLGRVAADEFEILNLAVAKTVRRRGIATKLADFALQSARSEGVRRTYLEVRASNQGAIAFYARLGFLDCGRRPKYYRDPMEDAVLLVLHNEENIL